LGQRGRRGAAQITRDLQELCIFTYPYSNPPQHCINPRQFTPTEKQTCFTPGTNEACDLFVVGETFETFSLALAFPVGFPASSISALNEAIVRLQTQQGALDMFENT
jgi:hypothetical protein